MTALPGSDSPALADSRLTSRASSSLASLISQIAAGDHGAVETLHDRIGAYVCGIAIQVLQSAADAEEVTSDVFSQVWRMASRYDANRGSVVSWLTVMTRSRSPAALRPQ